MSAAQPADDAQRPTRSAGDARPQRTGRRSRFTLGNWGVRRRLIALIAVPTVAAMIFGGLRVSSAAGSAIAFQRVERMAELGGAVSKLAQAIEDERDITAGFVADGRQPEQLTPLRSQYAVTDADARTVQRLAAQIGNAYPAVARQKLARVLVRIADLPALRSLATDSRMTALPLITAYSNVTADLFSFNDEIAQGSANAELTDNVRSLGSVSRMGDEASQQRGILYAALIERRFDPGAVDALTASQARQASDLAAFQTSATLPETQFYTDTVTGQLADQAQAMEQQAVVAGETYGTLPASLVGGSNAQTWYQAMSYTIHQMRVVEAQLMASIISQSRALQRSAARSAAVTGGITLLILLLVLLITAIVARSMIRPLRVLRQDALAIADTRLPRTVRQLSEAGVSGHDVEVEPIGVTTTDEIGEVARAFDRVHQEAVRLAAEEAMLRGNLNAMFVNLSRRSQSLIERQLALIDSLEQGEQEPARLSNLFRLDHLATRMRRNSENLLVLAGHEVPRRWSDPVPLVDVLRAAISEIEQYERVTLSVQPNVVVIGHAVNDVVHLVAELVENATVYSPAGTQVQLTGQPLSSGGVLLDITDAGVGMSDEELAEANQRLDTPPVVDVAVSRRMGLFVVGRLAMRHGIRVRLRHAPGGGLTALVWLPEAVATQESGPFGRFRPFGIRDQAPRPSLSAPTTAATGSFRLGTAAPVTFGPGAPATDGTLPATASHGPTVGPLPPSPVTGQTTPSRAGFHDGRTNGPDAPRGTTDGRSSVSPSSLPPGFPPPVAAGGGAMGRTDPAMPVVASGPMPLVASGPVPIVGGDPSPHRGGSPPLGEGGEVTIPAPAGQDPDTRLPIYDSLESDWFHRGRASVTGEQRAGPGEQARQPTSAWRSPADEGWRAARNVANPATGELTAAGLPRRVPRANLVPGSIDDTRPTAAGPLRSAEIARQRLASFQRGVRDARAAVPTTEDHTAMTEEP